MTYTSRLDKALKISAKMHENQHRKDDEKTPYIIHPVGVMSILAKYTDDEDLLIAGLLHDVLEDVKLPYEEKEHIIEINFGGRVLSIVRDLSEEKDPMRLDKQLYSWMERKRMYLEKINNSDEDVLLVCAADKIHNLLSLIIDIEREGDAHWNKFKTSPEGKLWLFEEVYKIVSKKLQNPIVQEFNIYLTQVELMCQRVKKQVSV